MHDTDKGTGIRRALPFECVRYYMPSEVVSDHKVVIAELRFK